MAGLVRVGQLEEYTRLNIRFKTEDHLELAQWLLSLPHGALTGALLAAAEHGLAHGYELVAADAVQRKLGRPRKDAARTNKPVLAVALPKPAKARQPATKHVATPRPAPAALPPPPAEIPPVPVPVAISEPITAPNALSSDVMDVMARMANQHFN